MAGVTTLEEAIAAAAALERRVTRLEVQAAEHDRLFKAGMAALSFGTTSMHTEMRRGFEAVDGRLGAVEGGLEEVKDHLANVEGGVEEIKGCLEQLGQDATTTSKRLAQMDATLVEILRRLPDTSG